MDVSVVLCTYSGDIYTHFEEAVESVRDQTYEDVEVVIVVDGNESLFERVRSNYGDSSDVQLHCNDENVGLLESRNTGARLASGDIVAFMDDDAVADPEWVEELVKAYSKTDASAVGGKMTGKWVAGNPDFLPEEFYWLVGVTHRGFTEEPGYVRNTFGSNISFRRDVFLDLGGFDTEIGGRKGDKNLQGGETELCVRLAEEMGSRVWYNPDAEVAHKVFDYRTEPRWLLNRAFWQGYSKRAMEVIVPDSGDAENEFLDRLLTEFLPIRLRGLVREPSVTKLSQIVMVIVFTIFVGSGYVYGVWKW